MTHQLHAGRFSEDLRGNHSKLQAEECLSGETVIIATGVFVLLITPWLLALPIAVCVGLVHTGITDSYLA